MAVRRWFAAAPVTGVIFALLVPQPAAAGSRTVYFLKNSHVVAPGKYRIGRRQVKCGSARTVIAPRFPDYGGALPGMIILNPGKLRRISLTVRRFVYAHECGHQIVGRDETAADRYAIQRGRRMGWLNRRGVKQICRELFRGEKGDRQHPPGAVRCRAIANAYNDARPVPEGRRARNFNVETGGYR